MKTSIVYWNFGNSLKCFNYISQYVLTVIMPKFCHLMSKISFKWFENWVLIHLSPPVTVEQLSLKKCFVLGFVSIKLSCHFKQKKQSKNNFSVISAMKKYSIYSLPWWKLLTDLLLRLPCDVITCNCCCNSLPHGSATTSTVMFWHNNQMTNSHPRKDLIKKEVKHKDARQVVDWQYNCL